MPEVKPGIKLGRAASAPARLGRLLVTCAVVFGSLAALGASRSPASVPDQAPATSASLRAFQLVAPDSGWVLIDNSLHWTDTGGREWRQLSPPLAGAAIRAVSFADLQFGWLVASGSNLASAGSLQLFQTADGGRRWQASILDLPPEVAALAGEIHLQIIDARTGWLVVKQATSGLFSMGTLFKTQDGGLSWQQLKLPAGGRIQFTTELDGLLESGSPAFERYATHDGGLTWQLQPAGDERSSLAELSMASEDVGWAKSVNGECHAETCQLVTRLLQTSDGGQQWADVPLPGGQTSLSRTFAAPAGGANGPEGAADGLSLVYHGDGFDTCRIGVLPSLADMQTWFTHSPYRVRNLYLGGASLPNCGQLTAGYVQQLAQQGWLFIPTWVGPQPPCSNVGHKMSADPATAFNQGLIDADLALDAAGSLGFTLEGQSGTILYYDIEHFNPPANDPTCRQAAQAFISGWTAGLRAHDNLSGVYGSPCGSYIADHSAIPNVPDAVWLAVWSYPSYEPNVPMFGFNCIHDSLWTNSQRLRQYTGGHSEGWGGASLTIDSDAVHGPVTTVRGGCVPDANQAALFLYPHYAGACVLKGAGSYSTPASLNLPNDAISSVRVGANVILRLCSDELHAGTCEDFTDDAPQLSSHPVGDNQVSSAIVQPALVSSTSRIFLPVFPLSPSLAGIPNGSFENGQAIWGTASTQNRPLIVTAGQVISQGVAPHAGGWLAWLGGADGETASLSQTLAVPAESPYLAYQHWLASTETSCSFDFATVWVDNTAVDSYGLCTGANTNGWVNHVVDLSAYAGATINLRIALYTDSSLITSLFIDDVVFQTLP